jgi:UDP-N-acetylmuramoyl-L-alanyl-D-glutamate--2,6-diaminopimelate ligase
MSVEHKNLFASLNRPGECWVSDLLLDSRQVVPQSAFVLLKPEHPDVLTHLNDALQRGAKAVVVDHIPVALQVSLERFEQVVQVPQLAENLGQIAHQFYGLPSDIATVTGMTGTNGKTTTMWLHAQVTQGLYIGTVGVGLPPHTTPSTHTTADVLTLHRTLHQAIGQGIKKISLEVSSHALDQKRTAWVRMPVVGFSNLTRDHLDYHLSLEAYFAAKCKIFAQRGVETAVLNADDSMVRGITKDVLGSTKVFWVGRDVYHGSRFVRLESVSAQRSGLIIKGETHEGSFTLSSALIGQFNAENLIMVMGLCLANNMPLAVILERLSIAKSPPGRMEMFKGRGATIVVDYAHTPDALSKALSAISEHSRGKIYCVFGCGGDRDTGKRPMMGQIAEQQADVLVLTNDNPRNENPSAIIEGIRTGLRGIKPMVIHEDRATAIRWAYEQAKAEDWVLVAGKGHEDYQIIRDTRINFSDRQWAQTLSQEAA